MLKNDFFQNIYKPMMQDMFNNAIINNDNVALAKIIDTDIMSDVDISIDHNELIDIIMHRDNDIALRLIINYTKKLVSPEQLDYFVNIFFLFACEENSFKVIKMLEAFKPRCIKSSIDNSCRKAEQIVKNYVYSNINNFLKI